MKQIWLWWSSGKDSAWALHLLNRRDDVQVTALVTTVNSAYDRVAMHAVRNELLEQQASAAGIELRRVSIAPDCTNETYEAAANEVVVEAQRQGVASMAFGDLYLQDVRAYRLNMLKDSSVQAEFPLWQLPTAELAQTMIDGGLRAYVTCVDPRVLPAEFAGRAYDQSFIDDLPDHVDPCGENGEFHTFVHDGPMFQHALDVRVGEVVERDGFVFADVASANAES